ncbi:MAG TPA: chloride channel protein [Solirubrobacteraceae bacterium]|nr:chloride channel protein [Solirubrobacteraceae bacterium]
MALVVGAGAGLGAAGFRELIFLVTWLATGHTQFGEQGHAPSLHLAFLGIWFVLVVPVLGGLLYGPLIQRFAREARGHGVPEVMLAVAENGGRIRPPVTIVKALASAITIGTGGSVGREGPIVQIGAALASTLGQWVRMSEHRLRIIVACGAAGGIAATFNAPITGLFFGFEIVLREFSLDALFTTSLAAVTGDVISRAFFGSAPFFASIPHDLTITNDGTYLLVAVLALVSGLIGLGFKTVLYGMEDRADALWRGRPEWARPAVGGVVLGLLLLALPQMYGVGYPVMDSVIAGHVVLGLVLLFLVGKVVAASLTLSIGGSGGVFAPSLFIGTMAGMAFGIGVHHVFGPAVGPPALYAVVAMGGVFAGAAQAPLTAIASVVEMTGNFTLTLPIMLASGIAAALSKQLSYGSVYTTKLLRRGIDIERPRAANVLETLNVAHVMQPIQTGNGLPRLAVAGGDGTRPSRSRAGLERLGPVVAATTNPQELFEDETLEQALRQLTLHGRSGLPVLSGDRQHLRGWITRRDVLRALAQSIDDTRGASEAGAVAADFGADDPEEAAHRSSAPLNGYEIVDLSITPDSPAAGRRISDVDWPDGAVVVAITDRGEIVTPGPSTELRAGERVIVLTRSSVGLPAATHRESLGNEADHR